MPANANAPLAGVQFPADATGKRSTLAGGKAVWAAAVRPVDPALADAITAEKNWRMSYIPHVVKAMEAGAKSPEAAVAIAEAGLAAVYSTFDFVRDGKSVPLPEAMAQPLASAAFSTASVKGSGVPAGALSVPYEGKSLEGEALLGQLKTWTTAGTMEPGVEAAIAAVAKGGRAHLDLSSHVYVVLGATSALGPLQHLLRWGATVIGVARQKPQSWAGLISAARASAGTLIFPVRGGANGQDGLHSSDADLAAAAGADLMVDAPELLAWLKGAIAQTGKPPVVGMYTYLDSDAHVRVSIACDAIMKELAPAGSPAVLAYIQTPSLAYDIPEATYAASRDLFAHSWLGYLGFEPNARAPVAGTTPPRYVHDGLMSLQGPNYALAKNVQMWRGVVARARDGLCVSANCAPPARTASMVAGDNKNASTVAAGLDGMGYFKPMACFDQETVSACMAALLAHDVGAADALANPKVALTHPYDLFSHQAFHGGSFRVGVKPSQLGKLFYVAGKLRGPASAL